RHSPSTLKASDFYQLALECEVGVRLGADLGPGGAPYDRGTVSEAVESLMPAFEVVDVRRTPGVDKMVGFITGVAANIFNAGVVLGAPVTNWRELDLEAAYGSMTINDEMVGDGHGSDVMGHPLEPLAWLANKLAEQDLGLTAGMVIITGSIVPPKPVKPGDTASIDIEGLGGAELEVV
nr:fumarylacetoacetate hydrolase family protein [Chloroflexota bacterium]